MTNSNLLSRITVNPDVSHGKPTIRNLRYPVETILEYLAGGDSADADETVAVTGGALEASNVSAVATMIEMISLSRQFDLAMKMLQNAENDAQRATQLLSTNPA